MPEYTPPPGSERFAEFVHRSDEESARQMRRLKDAPTDEVKRVALDRNESIEGRCNAIDILQQRRVAEMPDILLTLMDEPDLEVWRSIIRSYCPADPRVEAKLRERMDDPRDRVWSEAACVLARRRDESILPRVLEWFRHGDEPHRNVAIECLLSMNTPEARRYLADSYHGGGRSEEDRIVLAVALLRIGDPQGLPFLEGVARRADGAWAVTAATWILTHQKRLGLELMRSILDHGTLEAQQSMVSQIWNFSRSPHAFTADGFHDARAWIDQEFQGLSSPHAAI